MYASAVAITQAFQYHAIDPSECDLFTRREINTICTVSGVFSEDEEIIFKVAVLMLRERHEWSYGENNKKGTKKNAKSKKKPYED